MKKGSLAAYRAEKPRFSVLFHPEIVVLGFARDESGDVRVIFRYHGRKSRGLLYGTTSRWFLVNRQRIYLSDLREVA